MHSELKDVCISFYDDVYYYIFSLTRDKEISKDVTQETFLKALKSLHNLKEPSKVKSWLFTIARNNYLTEMKKRKSVIFDDLVEELVDINMLTPEQAYLLQEKKDWLAKLLTNLNGEEKKILELRVNEKYSYDEIAEKLQIKTGAVRVKFHRLRVKLVNLIRERAREDEGL